MATDDLLIRLGLRGQAEVARGLRKTASETRDVGDAAETAGAKAREMGAMFSHGADKATVSIKNLLGAYAVLQGAQGLGRLTIAGVKWGLSFNSQVEQARLRFQLFTTDVDGLTKSVQAIDKASMFNFADLADAAALLGGSGIKDVPKTLQAAANAAAGGGKGTEGLKSIVLALSQIASKGRLSQEEVNQLTEGGAITAQRDLTHGLHLTAKELQNLGGQGIEAKKALDVLTKAWTTGEMADAAKRQLGTLSGQWGLLTGDAQKLSGVLTLGLAHDLEKNVIPAANHATDAITAIFGQKGLSNQEKLRQAREVIRRDLGPVADDLKKEIDAADIPGHLGDAVRLALPKMAAAAGEIAPDVAKAFVDAWMHSGPWIQILSLLALAGKIGGATGGRGGGGVVGGLTSLVSKSKPLPVWVVNAGGMPGSPTPTGTPPTRSAARTLAETAGKTTLVGGVLYGAGLGAKEFYDTIMPAHHSGPPVLKSPADRAIDQQVLASRAAARSLGDSPVVNVYPIVQIEGRNVATATARNNAKQRARN